MSKGLSRVRALVSQIDSIQTGGGKPHPVTNSSTAEKPQEASVSPVIAPAAPAENNVVTMSRPLEEQAFEKKPVMEPEPEGSIHIQLSGKIAVHLQLEDSDEVVEIRQLGESIEIRFNDGKAIHLPMKSVA